MNRTTKTLTTTAGILAAALSGMLTGCHQNTGSDAGSSMNAADLDKHNCKGLNQCKAHGGCKTAANSCKGQNSCKAQGGCNTNKSPNY